MRETNRIFCNKCGKEFSVHNDIVQEGIFNIEYLWGYFSKRDGEIHSFDLCEMCYNKIIQDFEIPVTTENSTEMI